MPSIGHFVVRAQMLEAAHQENLDVDRLSFTGCLQFLQARLPECHSKADPLLKKAFAETVLIT
jgi:hypothetical protein